MSGWGFPPSCSFIHSFNVLIAHYNDEKEYCGTETHQQQFKILKLRGKKSPPKKGKKENESLFA